MNERHQADLLARWLASGARGEPPAGLDPDTVAAVYALRPELAPAPGLTADDILDGLTAGPFATPEADAGGGGEVVPFPVPASRPTVVPQASQDAAPPAPGAHRKWWIGGGAGLLAAAAAALLVLSPSGAPVPNLAKVADRSRADEATTATPQAVAPAAAPIAEVAAGEALPDANAAAPLGNQAKGGLAGGLIGVDGAPPSAGGGRDMSTTRDAAPNLSGYAAAPPVAPAEAQAPALAPTPAQDAVAQVDDADAAQTGGASAWGGAPVVVNTAVEEKEELRAEQKMSARAAGPASTAPAASTARTYAQETPAQATDATPAFDATAVIAAASEVAATDPLAAARQLEPFIRQGTPADGQRIALTAARYARDAGDLDKAEVLARAGLARGANAGPDAARLTSLISAIAQTRAADQASPAAAPPGN